MTSQTLLFFLLVSYVKDINGQVINCDGGTCNCPEKLTAGAICILDCNIEDICKGQTLNCRAGDPCEIRCEAKSSCSAAIINANAATDVTVFCSAEDSCKNNIDIFCGTGHCNLQCDERTSCEDLGNIHSAHSQSFKCTGNCPNELTSFTLKPLPTNNPISATLPLTKYPTKYPSKYPSKSPAHDPSKSPTLTPSIIIVSNLTDLIHTNDEVSPFEENNKRSKLRYNWDIILIILTVGFCFANIILIWLLCYNRKQLLIQSKTLHEKYSTDGDIGESKSVLSPSTKLSLSNFDEKKADWDISTDGKLISPTQSIHSPIHNCCSSIHQCHIVPGQSICFMNQPGMENHRNSFHNCASVPGIQSDRLRIPVMQMHKSYESTESASLPDIPETPDINAEKINHLEPHLYNTVTELSADAMSGDDDSGNSREFKIKMSVNDVPLECVCNTKSRISSITDKSIKSYISDTSAIKEYKYNVIHSKMEEHS